MFNMEVNMDKNKFKAIELKCIKQAFNGNGIVNIIIKNMRSQIFFLVRSDYSKLTKMKELQLSLKI